MSLSVTQVLVISALWLGDTESTAGSPSSDSGLRGRLAPPHTAAQDLMLTLKKYFEF